MKKFFVSSVILSLMVFAGCSEMKTIEQRIAALEEALNNNDYLSFLGCFSEDAENYGNYSIGDFTTLTGAGTISWDFGNLSISGNTASCGAIKTIGGVDTAVLEEFDMVEDGDGYLILQWREDGDIMLNIKKK